MAATQTVRIVPMAFLCLIVLINSASAECAWVLWGSIFDKDGIHYSPIRADSTKAECEEARERAWARAEARASQGGKIKEAFVCFPDTIDPRGPKGR